EILRSSSAFRYRESRRSSPDPGTAPDWPGGVDPYRLRRALDLSVSDQDVGVFRVAGGLEPHLVQFREGEFVCDCADAARGHLCKHVFAVRLHRQDSDLHRLVQQLRTSQEEAPVDIFGLWFGSSTRTEWRGAR